MARNELRTHLARHTFTYYDQLPDGRLTVAVIDRRPLPPPRGTKVRTLRDAAALMGYGGPPFFMYFDSHTSHWEFLTDLALQAWFLARIAAGQVTPAGADEEPR